MRRRGRTLALRTALSFFLSVSAALSAGTLSGRLVDSEGRPVADARVTWVRFLEDDENLLQETEGREPEVLGETRSDANGAFRAVLEKPGLSIALRVQAAGLPEARLSEPFDSGDTAALDDLHFPAAAKLAGKVTDPKGTAVAGARVRAVWDDDTESGASFVSETRTGADGSWSLPSAPEGAGALRIRADGFVPVSRFALRRGMAETTVLRRGGGARGTVSDSAGKPVAGAIVIGGDVAARTDAAGAFVLNGLASGPHTIETQWKEEYAARKEIRAKDGESATVALKLVRAAAISGTVIDETTRRAIPGARITVREAAGFDFRRGGGRQTRADARGRFRSGGLSPGRYRLSAVGRGYIPSDLPGVVAAVPTGAALAIALRREAAVAGRVVDESGQAVAGARVAVQRDFGPRRMSRLGRGAFAAPETRTGPDGMFSLRRLNPASGVTLEAAKAGYAAARKTGLTLKSGETLKGVSLLLRRGLSARGRVIDGEGKGIAGAAVQANHAERGRRGFAMIRLGGAGASERPDATTGADGGFELRGLEASRYLISASKEGLVPKAPATLDVSEKGENEIPPIVLDAGSALAGTVRNKNGDPVPGAEIFVTGELGRPLQASTDPAGRFRVSGVVSGRPVGLFVSAEGYAVRQSSATPPAETLAIVLDTAATVRGRVEDADSQSPLADFSISRSEASSGGGGMVIRMVNGREARAFHSDDGTFELSDVPAGRWTIRAEAAGYRAAEIAGVEVGPGETKDGVVLSLKKGGTLTGRVVDAVQGSPVANASVSWTASGGGSGGGGMRFGPDTQQSTGTDADGRFSFDSLPDGKVRLQATHPDYTDGAIDVDPQHQSNVEIPLGSGGSISGTVVGSDGRTPASGARVALDTEGEAGRFGGDESTTADGSGAYQFDHLKSGRYQLTAQGNAGSSAPREVLLSDNQRADGIVLQTATGTLLQGSVTGLPAGALAGVRIFASSSGYSDGATTDADGHFTIPDVPSGVLRVSASTSVLQGRTAQTTVEIPDGAPEFPVEIAFQGSSRLSGQVTRGGRPLSGLFVLGVPDPPNGAGRSSSQTDGDGRYALEGLSDGAYDVTFNGQGVSYRKQFDVTGDTAGDVVLPATTLAGTVRDDATGQPIEGADIQAETGQESEAVGVKRASTDSTGAYSIDAIDPGTYQVTARKAGYRLRTQTANVGSDPASLDFSLQKGAGLSIRVADGQTGIPLSGVQVLAFAGDGTVAFQGRIALAADGTGEVPSLSDGHYAIYVFSDGYAPRSMPIDLPSAPVGIAMTPGGRVEVRAGSMLSGRLVDAGGAPVLLSPFRLDGGVTAAPPVTVWDHLAPGAYRLLYGDNTAQGATFNVVEGQTTQVTLN